MHSNAAMTMDDSLASLGASSEACEYTAPGVPTIRRRIFVTNAALPILTSRWKPSNGESEDVADARRAGLLALLAQWQKGDPLVAGQHIKPLRPPPACDGVWELRETRIRPQMRVIGHVPARNIFVVTGVYPRWYLGLKGSSEWNVAISNALAHSRKWFPGQPVVNLTTPKFRQSEMILVCDDF